MRFLEGLSEDIKKNLLEQLRVLWTHASTAIEGNTLTLGETAFVLSEGLTISGKPLKDHRDIEGHARAIDLLYGLLNKDEITTADLFDLHRLVIDEQNSRCLQACWRLEKGKQLRQRHGQQPADGHRILGPLGSSQAYGTLVTTAQFGD